jgi:hypothetical protein
MISQYFTWLRRLLWLAFIVDFGQRFDWFAFPGTSVESVFRFDKREGFRRLNVTLRWEIQQFFKWLRDVADDHDIEPYALWLKRIGADDRYYTVFLDWIEAQNQNLYLEFDRLYGE